MLSHIKAFHNEVEYVKVYLVLNKSELIINHANCLTSGSFYIASNYTNCCSSDITSVWATVAYAKTCVRGVLMLG